MFESSVAAFLEEIRRKMVEEGISLAQALQARYAGRFDAHGARDTGARNARLSTKMLNFDEV